MRNNNNLDNIFSIFLLVLWILSLNFIILWSIAQTRKQTAETNRIVKEILAEKK